jgi:hypothetical protein
MKFPLPMTGSAPLDLKGARWAAISRLTMSRLRWRTLAMSVVIVPNCVACRAR